MAEKINLIEYRQKKMVSKSRYVQRNEDSSVFKQSKTMRMHAKSTSGIPQDVSKVVIKELKTVKDEIRELKDIM